MKEFLGFLNNPWITGIGGGAVSGFLVYFITSHLLSRKEDKEKFKKEQSEVRARQKAEKKAANNNRRQQRYRRVWFRRIYAGR